MAAEPKLVLNLLDVVASDFDATVAFYRRLGVELGEVPPSEGIRHAEVKLANGFVLHIDNEKLASLYNPAWRAPGGSCRAVIGFEVPSREAVDQRYAELVAAGHRGKQPPYDAFWGARYAIVADPDGNDVGIMSPPDESRRSWPPRPAPAP